MNRTLYEIAHFVAVVGLAYLALFVVRALGITDFWVELLVALAVGVSYVLVVFSLGIAPASWRGQ